MILHRTFVLSSTFLFSLLMVVVDINYFNRSSVVDAEAHPYDLCSINAQSVAIGSDPLTITFHKSDITPALYVKDGCFDSISSIFPGVWLSFTGTGEQIIVKGYEPHSSLISVLTGGCIPSKLQCIAATYNGCEHEKFAFETTFGIVYYVLVQTTDYKSVDISFFSASVSVVPKLSPPLEVPVPLSSSINKASNRQLQLGAPSFAPTGECQNIFAKYYDIPSDTNIMPNFQALAPSFNETVGNINFEGSANLGGSERSTNIGAVFETMLKFPVPGEWSLCIYSDNGSRLYLDSKLAAEVIYDPGTVCFESNVSSFQLVQSIRLEFFQAFGPYVLKLEWEGPTTQKEIIPPCAFEQNYIHCDVIKVHLDDVVEIQANDMKHGIQSISLSPPNNPLLLNSDFLAGDKFVNFSLSIPKGTPPSKYRDVSVIVKNALGQTCGFPSFGAILDDDCINRDECYPDPPTAFTFHNKTNTGMASLNFSSFEILVPPSFANVEVNGTNVVYIPTWSGIFYDSFVFKSNSLYNDILLVSVQYFGENRSMQVYVDIIGHWTYYIWDDAGDIEVDEGSTRSRELIGQDRAPRSKVHWHHIYPKELFLNMYKIEGLDINAASNGILLLGDDHNSKGGFHEKYNKEWEERLKNYKSPMLNDVTAIEKEISSLPWVKEIHGRGLINHGYEYNNNKEVGWRQKNPDFKKEFERQLLDKRAKRLISLANALPFEAGKLTKVSKALPGVGNVISLGFYLHDIYTGRPFWEATLDHGLDVIPYVGTLRLVYDLSGIQLFSNWKLQMSAEDLERAIWALLKDILQQLDRDSDAVSEAYPGKLKYHDSFIRHYFETDRIFF